MSELQMVDLRRQYAHLKDEINTAIQEVLETGNFINGSPVQAFADELAAYLGVRHVVPCGNGTDALQIALMALGLQPGDEVITVPFTFVATAEVIALLGLKPVFVDVNPCTFNLNEHELERAITPRTKCIVPVHLFGQAANMEAILSVAQAHGLHVVEDNAQSIGAKYRFSDGSQQALGTIGDIGCTSFFPSKNLGAYGDGGALFTNDTVLAERLRKIVNHGQSKRYHYDVVGVNSRLDTLQAVVLRAKLRRLDQYNAARQRAAAYYSEHLADIPALTVPKQARYSEHVYHQYTLLVAGGRRDALQQYLQQQGVPSAVYYPVPIHLQQAYTHLGYGKGSFPVSEALSEQVISLPMHTELTPDIQDRIIAAVRSFFDC